MNRRPTNHKLKAWIYGKGIRPVDIARTLKVPLPQVSRLFNGERREQRIRDYLLELGCPSELLEWKGDQAQ